MTVEIKDFQHSFEVFLDDVGDCTVAFDISDIDVGDTIADKPYCDFAVFDAQGNHITYDISKAQYEYCYAAANLEMEQLLTDWKKEWEIAFYEQRADDRDFAARGYL